MISGRLGRALQVSSESRVSSGLEILGGEGDTQAEQRFIKDVQVEKSAFEFIF